MITDGLLAGEKRGRDLFVSSVSVRTQKSAYGQLSTAMRIRVFVRDSLTCTECSFNSDDPSDFHVHHKVPRAEGGTNDIENLTTVCCDCHKILHGAKSIEDGGSKRINMRLKTTVRFMLEDLSMRWKCTETAAMERAILQAHESPFPGVGLAHVVPLQQQTNEISASIARHQAQSSSVPETPFHPRCLHCGENFGAWNRNASLCPDCKEKHHAGDPANCPTCTAGSAI